jgi:hypothetical protein
MSKKSGLLLAVAALAVLAAWAAYGHAQDPGPLAAGTPSAAAQSVEEATPACCEPAGCGGGCTACPTFVDKDNDGVCDTAGTCAKHANGGCGGHKGWARRCSSL